MPSNAFQVASRHEDDPSSATSGSPRALIKSILDGGDVAEAVAALIQHLSRPGYSVMDLLGDVKHFKQEIAKTESSAERLADRWALLDLAIEKCLALTTSSHEEFIDKTLHAFFHYDDAGIVVSANNKMLDLIPKCIGQHVTTCFGKMESDVRLALAGGSRQLYQLKLQAQAGRLPVLAEFGTVRTGSRGGGYALLVDMSNLVEAEHKALESAPNGMLKLDAKHCIVYANKKAVTLSELSFEELLGRDARRLITDPISRARVNQQGIERRKGRGGEYSVVFTTPKSGKRVNLYVTSVPTFHTSGAYSGSLVGLQPIDYLVARQTIAHLVGTESDYQVLYRKIIEVVKEFVEFDWANLFIYSPRRDYSRIVCPYGPEIEFQSRWFSTPAGYIDWLSTEDTWMRDLEKDIAAGPNPEYLERIDSKATVAAGMKALVCLPVASGGRVIGGFCLASKKAGIYGRESRKVLEHLTLDQAFLPLFNAIDAAERDFVNGLVKEIAGLEDMQAVAEKVVGELAKFYDFQNVSIFKVNALRGHFRLLAQALGPKGGTPMPEAYTQSIESGMLGLCYQRRDCAILKDVADDSDEAKVYIKVAPEVRSELCIPVLLFNRVLWILNLEDCVGDAFTPIEVEKLQDVIRQMQATLERIFQSLVLGQVLDVCPAAIVITDQKHRLVRPPNKEARQMLQRDAFSLQDNFEEFLPISPDDLSTNPTMTTVLGAEGGKVEVMATRFTLDEEYDHTVFMLQNVDNLQWTAKFETLRAALAETTAQVRIPVSLLSSFVQRIGQKVEDEKLKDLTRKAMRQINRIELTYDRVLACYQTESLPTKNDVPFDVKLALDHILSELPDLDRKTVRQFDGSRGPVRADPYRVLFALSSMLAYLLRSRSNDEPIVIKVQNRNDIVEVSMTGMVPRTPPVNELAALVEVTRAEIALGKDVLVRIAHEAGGDFELQRQAGGRERLCLRMATLGNRS